MTEYFDILLRERFMNETEKKTILIIDDEDIVRVTFQRILDRLGYNTLDASNGSTGLEIVRRIKPDLVMVDLLMPQLDGFQVISTLKEEMPEMPVIAVSGIDILNEAIRAIRVGAWDYILKPITQFDILNHSIQRCLERSELLHENRVYREHLEDVIQKRTQELEERSHQLEESNVLLEKEIETRREAEEEVKKLNRDLEKRVEERTKELKKVNHELHETLSRLQEDEKAGRRIQFQLLPQAIQLFGPYEFSRYLIPSTYLSGDFLDYFAIGDRYIGFYIADVSGHGVSSAFVTVLLKSFINQHMKKLQASIDDTILNPAALLQELNLEIINQHIEKYLTMFYAVIDKQTETMVCANGGQFPFPIIFDGVTSRFIEQNGFPVGVFDFSTYENRTLELPPEFAIYFISDGFLEVIETHDPVERNKLLLSLVNRFDLSLVKLVDQYALNTKAIPDDITFVKLRKRPSL